jgi:hypothetical protein
MSAVLIYPNKEPVEITPENGRDFRLEELYRHLQCSTIQVIGIDVDRIMILDEDGKSNAPVEPNIRATLLALPVLMPDDWIAGPAIICPAKMLR